MIIYHHCETNKIIESQQKECAKDVMVCKEDPEFDSIKRNLFTVSYKRTFDSMPLQWLLDVLKLYKVEHHMISSLELTKEAYFEVILWTHCGFA